MVPRLEKWPRAVDHRSSSVILVFFHTCKNNHACKYEYVDTLIGTLGIRISSIFNLPFLPRS